MKRLLVLRISLLVLAITSQSYLIYLIRTYPGDDLFLGEIIAISILIYTSTVISFGIRNFLRIWNSAEPITKNRKRRSTTGPTGIFSSLDYINIRVINSISERSLYNSLSIN